MHHYFILPFSLFIKCFLSKLSFPRHPHSLLLIMIGQVAKRDTMPQILHKPPLFYFIASPHKPKSYKYPLSFSLSSFYFSSSSSLLPATSNREATKREPPLASLNQPYSTTFNLSPSLCEDRPLLLDWGRVLLRWQDLGPVPSFWIGAELPFAGRSKEPLGECFSSPKNWLTCICISTNHNFQS